MNNTFMQKSQYIYKMPIYTEQAYSPAQQFIKCGKQHKVSEAISTVHDFNYQEKKCPYDF